jgi:hypothetical protein
MCVAKVLARLPFMLTAIRIRKPLVVGIISMSVMGLVKDRIIDRFGYALHAHEQHSSYQQFEDSVAHLNSLHKIGRRIQLQFTNSDNTGQTSGNGAPGLS